MGSDIIRVHNYPGFNRGSGTLVTFEEAIAMNDLGLRYFIQSFSLSISLAEFNLVEF